MENSSWLQDELGDVDNDYVIFDCPGQIELYSHMTVMSKLINMLQNMNFRICSVFVLDSQFMVDAPKFLSGTMAALSVMVNLELPTVNVLSKMDLLSKESRKNLDMYLEPEPDLLVAEMSSGSFEKKKKLTRALAQLISDYSLVRYHPLNLKDEQSIIDLKLFIDRIIQYGEDDDVKTRDFCDEPEND